MPSFHFLKTWGRSQSPRWSTNNQSFECDWCDANYVGYRRRHLYQRIDEHKMSGSIFNDSQSQHQSRTITSKMYRILKKFSFKFDCLLDEMFLIRKHKPCLNIPSDLIKAKLFLLASSDVELELECEYSCYLLNIFWPDNGVMRTPKHGLQFDFYP